MSIFRFVIDFAFAIPLNGGSVATSFVVVVLGLLLGLRVVRWSRKLGGPERTLILGTGQLAHAIFEEIESRRRARRLIVGIVDDIADLGRVVDKTRPHSIVVALAERRGRLPLSALLESRARGILVEDGVETLERLTGKVTLETLPPSSLIFSSDFARNRGGQALGRLFSVVLSALGLILLAPVFGLVALLVRLTSRGPVFFVQERVGRFGRPFKLIKFRTMRAAGAQQTSEWVRDNAERITWLGQCLRRFRLDELPQLVNVLLGHMNLVGPRPHPVTNFDLLMLTARNLSERSGEAIPYYSLRCAIRPGITGWAQVRYGYANSLDEELEKIRYDLYYLKHMSLRLDLRVLFETVRIMLSGRGAVEADAVAVREAREDLEAREELETRDERKELEGPVVRIA